jgi:hypothetical protein
MELNDAADMQAHAGEYLPGAAWLTLETWDPGGAEDVSASAFTRAAVSDKFGSSEQLLPEWIRVQSWWHPRPRLPIPS